MNHLYNEIDNALLQIQDGDVEEGLSLLYELVQQARNYPDVLFELAHVFYSLGHIDTTSSILKEMEPFLDEMGTDEIIEFRLLRSELLIDEGNLDQAMEELLECLELEPNFTRASILLADIYLMQDLPEVACKYLEDIIDEDPDQPDVRYFLAEILIDMGELDKARQQLNFLFGTEYDEKARISFARLLSKLGDFEEAFALFKQIASASASTEAFFGCALTSLQLRNNEQAVYYGTKVLELEPDHIGAYQTVSTALVQLGKPDKAKQLLEQAFQFNEQEEAIILKLIEVCYQLGDQEAAIRYLQHLEDTHEETEEVSKWKEILSVQ